MAGRGLLFDGAAHAAAQGAEAVASGDIKAVPDTSGLFDQSYLRAVYDGTTLVWPAR